MELLKRRILMNTLFKAQFNYCPIVWVYHSRSLNNQINRFHEHCLIIIYHNKRSNFEELLMKDNSVSIHHNNTHVQMYKVVHGISPEIMNVAFQIKSNTSFNLRYALTFLTEPIQSVFNGRESALYLGLKMWKQIFHDVKTIILRSDLKNKSENEPSKLPL